MGAIQMQYIIIIIIKWEFFVHSKITMTRNKVPYYTATLLVSTKK